MGRRDAARGRRTSVSIDAELEALLEARKRELEARNERLDHEFAEATGLLEGAISAVRRLNTELVRTLDDAAALVTVRATREEKRDFFRDSIGACTGTRTALLASNVVKRATALCRLLLAFARTRSTFAFVLRGRGCLRAPRSRGSRGDARRKTSDVMRIGISGKIPRGNLDRRRVGDVRVSAQVDGWQSVVGDVIGTKEMRFAIGAT